MNVREEFRKVFLELCNVSGRCVWSSKVYITRASADKADHWDSSLFRSKEIPTNKSVGSSFWNFDALFQPRQHCARDTHDTFIFL